MIKRFIIVFIFAIVSFLSSCTSSLISETASLRPLSNKVVIENLGPTSGEDSAVSLFGLFMFGHPDIDKAIERAITNKGADTLINVKCYETTSYNVLFYRTTVRVEGEAVKLADAPKETPSKGKKK